ncbi:MAG: hypothetical protein HOP20_04690 [Sulfuriferula sp.]|nr:hypothetical protein [Sulfuriferula sp.]
MNANRATSAHRIVLCSMLGEQESWLNQNLAVFGGVSCERGDSPTLVPRLLMRQPTLVIIDFSGEVTTTSALVGSVEEAETGVLNNAVALAHSLKEADAHLLMVGIGRMDSPAGVMAAWRAGVHGFIDMMGEAQDAVDIVHLALSRSTNNKPTPVKKGDVLALLSARPGVGASTLAAHFADKCQHRLRDKTTDLTHRHVCVLDLGSPTGDGQLYLGANGQFDFVEAVRNLHRLDATLINTAWAHSASGVAIVSAPVIATDLDMLSLNDVLALIERLRLYFDVVVIDLGGLVNFKLMNAVAGMANKVWVVTDQSVGALVSLAGVLKKLDESLLNEHKVQLIVNRYDERYGMSAVQIGERFQLPLLRSLPERALKLMTSANRGKLLHELLPSDIYAQAIDGLMDDYFGQSVGRKRVSWLAKFSPRKS